jgi:hypothetical protein
MKFLKYLPIDFCTVQTRRRKTIKKITKEGAVKIKTIDRGTSDEIKRGGIPKAEEKSKEEAFW